MKIYNKIAECYKGKPSHARRKEYEPKPFVKAVHVGRAILDGTLGESRSKLLLKGIYDTDEVEDFGQEPKRKETAKETE